MSEKSEELKERTMSFAVNILQSVEILPKTVGAQIAARQLAKSATSVGANYRAVCTARSDQEFIAKLCIVNEEADETVYWLESLRDASFFHKKLFDRTCPKHSNFAQSLDVP